MDRSRSAIYKHFARLAASEKKAANVVALAQEVRRKQPRVGCRKIHKEIAPKLQEQGAKIGRDKLISILGDAGMHVEPKKKFVKTTYSNHEYAVAPNRIKELKVTRPNQVFVSDITYIHTREGHAYLFLVTDLYSRKIVGYHLSKNLMHFGAINALKMALDNAGYPQQVIHHSDRGCQYCCHEFLAYLKDFGVVPSMTDAAHCYQNAVAERVNGILKDELSLDANFLSFNQAQRATKEAVTIYNQLRLHTSLEYKTPEDVYALAA